MLERAPGMKRLLFVVSLLLLAALPESASAESVMYCLQLEGALANARLLNDALIGKQDGSQFQSDLTKSKEFCQAGEVNTKHLRFVTKKPVVVTASDGSRKTLEVYVWFKGDPTPVLVKYYWADAYYKGKLVRSNLILEKKETVSVTEFHAALENARKKYSAQTQKKH